MKRRSVLLSGVALSGTALANDSIFFSPLKYLGAEQQRSIDASRSLLDNLIPPSLPQYDNLAGKLARRAVLTSKKLVYVWTENFANVKGVPMARSVPLGELPNVDWLLKTAGVIVELIVNFVASLPASAAAQFERIAAGLSGDLEAARQVHEALLEEAKNDPAAAGSLLLRFTELQTRVDRLTDAGRPAGRRHPQERQQPGYPGWTGRRPESLPRGVRHPTPAGGRRQLP